MTTATDETQRLATVPRRIQRRRTRGWTLAGAADPIRGGKIVDRRRERILADLHLLRGKDLACTCRPDQACHADYLLLRANMPPAELADWVAVVRARVDRQRIAFGEKPMYAPTP